MQMKQHFTTSSQFAALHGAGPSVHDLSRGCMPGAAEVIFPAAAHAPETGSKSGSLPAHTVTLNLGTREGPGSQLTTGINNSTNNSAILGAHKT